jgi:hypothetical protein
MEQTDSQKLIEIIDKRSSAYTDWMRHLVLLFSAIFGILVALPQHTPLVCRSARYILPVAVSLIAIGILSGLISLYGEVVYLKRLQKLWAEELSNSLHERREPEPVSVPPEKIFEVSETICYVLLCLSLLVLSLYAFVLVAD